MCLKAKRSGLCSPGPTGALEVYQERQIDRILPLNIFDDANVYDYNERLIIKETG